MADEVNRDYHREGSLKHSWSKETSCYLCHSPFGVIGLAYYKKYYCKYCLKAICADCADSPNEGRKIELVCKPCAHSKPDSGQQAKLILQYHALNALKWENYQSSIKESEKAHSIKEWELKLQSQELLFQESQTEENIHRLSDLKAEKIGRIEELKNEINSVCQGIEEKETLYFEYETYLMEEKNELDSAKKNLTELYRVLTEKQDENMRLSEQLEKSESPKLKRDKKEALRKESLRRALERLEQEEGFYSSEKGKLEEELNCAEQELEEKDKALEKAQQELEEGGDVEDEIILTLNATLKEQQKLIRILKEELGNKKAVNDFENNKCKCLSF